VQPPIDVGTIVGHALPARGMHRVWSAVMPKDLARTDYVNEFIDLLEKHAPTGRRPASVLTLAGGRRTRGGAVRHTDRPAV